MVQQYLFLIPYLIAGFGVFFLILSPGILKRWARFMRESIVVDGTVISVRRGLPRQPWLPLGVKRKGERCE